MLENFFVSVFHNFTFNFINSNNGNNDGNLNKTVETRIHNVHTMKLFQVLHEF